MAEPQAWKITARRRKSGKTDVSVALRYQDQTLLRFDLVDTSIKTIKEEVLNEQYRAEMVYVTLHDPTPGTPSTEVPF